MSPTRTAGITGSSSGNGHGIAEGLFSVEKLAAPAVFLCGDGAASITGTALPVDGGWTAQ